MTEISKLQDFWIDKIKKLQTEKLVSNFLLDDSDWKRNLQYKSPYYSEVSNYGEKIVREVYDKATANITPAPIGLAELLLDLPANDEGKSAIAEYTEIIQENLTYWGKETEQARKEGDLMGEVFEELFEKVLHYKFDKNDVPESSKENDPKAYFHHLKNNVLKKRSISKILKSERRLTKRLSQLSTKLQTILGTANLVNLPNGTTILPNDWATKLVKKDDLDTANAKITILTTERDQYKTKADKYDRIHTKLNGKVSDADLDNYVNHTCPACTLTHCSNTHNDYDTIKQERDTLKTENTQLKEHKCDCSIKVAQKETEIITKIITDLQLSTERERENVLEAVITEIKTKLAPPTDNSADKQKIAELETKIANFQAPKSLNDLPISQEVKAEVVKISQDLGLTAQSCAKLENATSYQELTNLQKEAFQEKLNSEVSSKDSAQTMNYCLGALSLGSLLLLVWMLIKQTKTDLLKVGEGKK